MIFQTELVIASTPNIGYIHAHSRPGKIMKCPNRKTFADSNWNVVATTNASGTVQEQMRYDAFGRIPGLMLRLLQRRIRILHDAPINPDTVANDAMAGMLLSLSPMVFCTPIAISRIVGGKRLLVNVAVALILTGKDSPC